MRASPAARNTTPVVACAGGTSAADLAAHQAAQWRISAKHTSVGVCSSSSSSSSSSSRPAGVCALKSMRMVHLARGRAGRVCCTYPTWHSCCMSNAARQPGMHVATAAWPSVELSLEALPGRVLKPILPSWQTRFRQSAHICIHLWPSVAGCGRILHAADTALHHADRCQLLGSRQTLHSADRYQFFSLFCPPHVSMLCRTPAPKRISSSTCRLSKPGRSENSHEGVRTVAAAAAAAAGACTIIQCTC